MEGMRVLYFGVDADRLGVGWANLFASTAARTAGGIHKGSAMVIDANGARCNGASMGTVHAKCAFVGKASVFEERRHAK